MFSLSDKAEHCIHVQLFVRLRVSNEQEEIFKPFIDEPLKIGYKIKSNNNKLLPVLQNHLFPKLEKPGLDYGEHFMLVSKDKMPVKESLCFF